MTRRDDILTHLNDYLDVTAYNDYCVNGLQVEGNPAVTRIVTGVSVSDRFIQAAIERQAQMIIVHHGLFWKNTRHPFALTGILRNRVGKLMEYDLNLAAYHLPLDAHPVIGNNAVLMKHIGLTPDEPLDVGFIGEFPQHIPFTELADRVQSVIPSSIFTLAYGKKDVQRIGIISGGAPGMIETAAAAGCDTFITGEVNEPLPRLAEELRMNFIAAGHYNTERFGPSALSVHLAEYLGIDTEFVDIDNPV